MIRPIAVASNGYITGVEISPLSIAVDGYLTITAIPVAVEDDFKYGGGRVSKQYKRLQQLKEELRKKQFDDDECLLIMSYIFTIMQNQ